MRVETTGQVFAEMLRGHGISHVFIVPAVFHSGMAALEDTDVGRVTTHHEIAAAYMADGYARAARKPGVCLAQAVGATNMAAGLRDAYLAGAPVICLTGGPEPASRYRYLYQMIEDFTCFGPVTKLNVRVDLPSRFSDLLRLAFRVATSGAPGPVHLELPGRLGEGVEARGDFEVVVESRFSRYPAYRPAAEPEAVREAAAALHSAERPVIVSGGGVAASNAGAELVELAEKLTIPVAVTLTGKDAMLEDHRLNVGLLGSYGRASANRLLEEADLVFLVGTRAGGLTTGNWRVPRPGSRVIQLDIEPAEVGRNYAVEVGLVGDVRTVLRQLIDELLPRGEVAARRAPGREAAEDERSTGASVRRLEGWAWLQRAHELDDAWRSAQSGHAESDAVPLRPERLCREITDALPERAVVVVDTGHAAIWAGTLIGLKRPGQRFIRCAGTLGWAFPASLGIKCALPDRPVVCFTGDGGVCYHLAELETAARAGLNVVVVVNNNGSLQQVKRGIDAAYGGTQRGRAREMWVFDAQTNYAQVAEAMGCLGIRVERPADLRPALERALGAERPALLDVITDIDAFPADPW
jgi:acetolactate synthase-1/2/3 large subunit